MRIRTHIRTITALSFAGILLLSGPAMARKDKDRSDHSSNNVHLKVIVPKGDDSGPEPIDQRAYEDYVSGLLYEGFGDLASAGRAYANALARYPQSSAIAFAYASVLLQAHKPLQALDAMKTVLKPDPDIYDLRAQCYRAVGDEQSAKNEYMKLIAVDTSNYMAYAFLGNYYEHHQLLDSVIWAYDNLQRFQPENYKLVNEVGRLNMVAGHVEEGKDAYRRSLDIEPGKNNIQTMLTLADIYRTEKNLDSAEFYLKKALSVDQDNTDIYRFLIGLYFSQDKFLQALPYVKQMADLTPEDPAPRRHLAALYMALDSLDAAGRVLNQLIDGGQPTYEDYFALGQLAIKRDNWKEAVHRFRQATQADSSETDGWLALGQSQRHLGDRKAEVATYLKGVDQMKAESSAVKLYFAAGAAYEQMDQVDSAISVFEMILDHDPNNDQVLNYLGYTLADRGMRLEYADTLIQRAIKLKPDNAAYLDSYGWVKYRLGDYDAALKYLARAASLDNDPEILDHLGEAYWATGEKDEAKKVWREVLKIQPSNDSVKEKLNR